MQRSPDTLAVIITASDAYFIEQVLVVQELDIKLPVGLFLTSHTNDNSTSVIPLYCFALFPPLTLTATYETILILDVTNISREREKQIDSLINEFRFVDCHDLLFERFCFELLVETNTRSMEE
ncbi:MAG: hypothetical protein ACFFD4_36295 [Candidatus Odinarchaeota archaeon]